MEKRRLGKTGHMSSILIFGSFALYHASQKEADAALEMAQETGINHIDVSPIYGQAEARLGSWFKRHGKKFFLAGKTDERRKKGARESLLRSLEKLHVDQFDLFQLHGVDEIHVLDTVFGPGGAMEAILEAREQGLVRFIGITGHKPPTQKVALERFDFDTVMFPLNRVHAAHFNEWNDWRDLLETVRRKDCGIMVIKSIARGTWEDSGRDNHLYDTWYEPFDQRRDIEKSLRYTLSQPITAAVLPGDFKLWPIMLEVANTFRPMTPDEERQAIDEVASLKPLAGPVMD